MFKRHLDFLEDKDLFKTALISLLILTCLVAIEIFTGWDSRKPTKVSMENIVYHNLVQEDKDNKIKLKNFGAITDYEYNEITGRMSNKVYKDFSLEERIIQNYILSYNNKNTVESKENLEKELNIKYSDFKKETTDQIEKDSSCLLCFLFLSYTIIVFLLLGLGILGPDLFFTLMAFLSFATMVNFVQEFFLGSTKIFLVVYIVLDILLVASKLLYSKNLFKRYEMSRKFEKSL